MKANKRHITKKAFLVRVGLIVATLGVLLYAFIYNGGNKEVLPGVTETEEIVAVPEPEKEIVQEQNLEQEEKTEQEPEIVDYSAASLKEKFIGVTEDKRIFIKWELPVEEATLTISDTDGNTTTEKVKGTDTYSFTKGEHGKFYVFELICNIGDYEAKMSMRRKFLDFDKLPVLMTLFINTEDGRDPPYTKTSSKKEGLFGLTIENNEFKNATINNETPVKIRVRGNSSAYGPKKSYKLVFDEKKDMLDMGEEYADKEWLLLGKSALQTYLGFQIGLFAGLEWEPRMRFVNVMLNGDWKGLYVLCESIKRHPKRVNLDEDGFLIEGDGYWWKEKIAVLDSDLLSDKIQFSFKYPKPETTSDERFLMIEKRIRQIEDFIKGNYEEELADLIDFDMFASWLVAHEIMGTSDGYGSNMFFYQKNFDNGTKLKMGPVWDFDTMFFEPIGGHSKFWTLDSTYFPFLLQMPSFKKVFDAKFAAKAPMVEQKMRESLEKLKDVPGLEESMRIDRYKSPTPKNIDNEIDRLMKRLHDRAEKLIENMKGIQDLDEE